MSTKLYQLELDRSIVNCGMSYVFQLGCGDFVIIDGGYFTPGEAERLFSFLNEKAGGNKVHIRGWFFTHAHQDHIGCFIDFIEKYHNDCIIDTLYYNFQPTRHRFVFGDWRKKSNDLATIKHLYSVLKKYSSYYSIHTLKTDEEFDIDELAFTVLYTADNLYPEKASFNDYSAVIRVSVAGQTILFLGDVQSKGSVYLLSCQKEKLRSDICQIAHHGFNGATKELYAAVCARVLLFPCPEDEFEKNKNSEVNSFVLSRDRTKEVYVDGRGRLELEFPYTPGSAVVYEKTL